MHRDFRRGFRHPHRGGGFRDRRAVNFHLLDEIPGSLRQIGKRPPEVEARLARAAVGDGQRLFGIFDRRVARMATRSPQMVHKLVARDGESPGGDGRGAIIGMPRQVQRKQRFLQHILRLGVIAVARAPKLSAKKGAQTRSDEVEKSSIRDRVPIERSDEDGAQVRF